MLAKQGAPGEGNSGQGGGWETLFLVWIIYCTTQIRYHVQKNVYIKMLPERIEETLVYVDRTANYNYLPNECKAARLHWWEGVGEFIDSQ